MKKNAVETTSTWKGLLFAAGIFFPVWIMLFFYARNAAYVRFDFIVFICGMLMLVSAFLWGAAYAVFRSPMSSFSVCVIFWIAFYAGPQIILSLHILASFRLQNAILVFVAVTTLLAFITARVLCDKGHDGKAAFFFSVMIGVLLMMNVVSSVRTAYTIHSGTDGAAQHFLKRDFTVEKTNFRKPNVYWFHCDGMLGFSSFEKYFADSQEDFLRELEKRDFSVNKQAMLESGHTSAVAIPALMSPGFYDAWLGDKLSSHEKAMRLRSRLSDVPLLAAARLNNEIIHAFQLAGYTSHTISPLNVYFYPTTDYFFTPQGTIIEGGWTDDHALLIEYLQLQEFLHAFAFPLSVLQYYMWNFHEIVKNKKSVTSF